MGSNKRLLFHPLLTNRAPHLLGNSQKGQRIEEKRHRSRKRGDSQRREPNG